MTSPEASASEFATAANRSRSVAISSEDESSLRSGRFEFEAIVQREIEPAVKEDDGKDNLPLCEEER